MLIQYAYIYKILKHKERYQGESSVGREFIFMSEVLGSIPRAKSTLTSI